MKYLYLCFFALFLCLQLASAEPARADAAEQLEIAIETGRRGAYELATRLITEVIDSGELDSATLAMAHNARALMLLERGLLDDALADFTRAIEIAPGDPDAYYNRADAWTIAGDPEKARADFEAAADAYFNRGNAWFDLGNYERSVFDYTKALEIRPGDGDAFLYRGISYKLLGQADKAIDDYDQALAINPQDIEAYNSRANALAELGRNQEALADYQTAIDLEPAYADAFYNRAILHMAMGNHELAVQDLNAVLSMAPQDIEALVKRGDNLLALGKPTRALADYDKALSLYPNDPVALLHRARANKERGRLSKAAADLELALELAPDNPELYREMALVLTMQDEPELAGVYQRRADDLEAGLDPIPLTPQGQETQQDGEASGLQEDGPGLPADPALGLDPQ